jgi:outer membrane protein assembly factor BamB
MPRRTSPPRWLWAFWIVALLLIVVVRRVIDTGDSGLTNVATFLLIFLSAIAGMAWFVFRSGHAPRVRWGSLIGLVIAAIVFSYAVEFRGWSGEMVPLLGLRGGAAASRVAPTDARGDRVVDIATHTAYDFTGFLGTGRDMRVDNVDLARDWETSPPELLWKQPIGTGWGGYAVVNGYAATLEERDGRELVTLYDVATGELQWARQIGEAFSHPLGGPGPRSTPLIHEGVVYVMGVRGHLVALAGSTGQVIWERDILRDYGISIAEEDANVAYGRPTSPLIVGDSLIVGVGGSVERRVSVVAYQKDHGEVLWEGGNHNISMASPAHGVLAGVEQVLMVNENFASGHDAATGQQLWEFPWPGMTAGDSSVSQAVPVAPDKVFISKGYGSGAALYQLMPRGDGTFNAEQVWHSARVLRTKLTNVAIQDGYAYGLSEGVLECVEVATGERIWKAGRYHHGQILLVGDVILVLTEDGQLVMVAAGPDSNNTVLGQFPAIEGHTWNTFALYGDIVLVRNGVQAAAYRLPLATPLMQAAPATPEMAPAVDGARP